MPDYIFNTTALSNFAAIERLDLLKTLYQGKAFTTIEVSHELQPQIAWKFYIETRHFSDG